MRYVTLKQNLRFAFKGDKNFFENSKVGASTIGIFLIKFKIWEYQYCSVFKFPFAIA